MSAKKHIFSDNFLKTELDINSNTIPKKLLSSNFSYSLDKAVLLACSQWKENSSHKYVKRWSYLLFLVLALVCLFKFMLCYEQFRISSQEEVHRRQYYTKSSHKVRISINRTFLIPNENFCRIHNPYLLVIVPSRVQSLHVREVIRATYATISRDRISEVFGQKVNVIVRTLFVLGTSENHTLERNILYEQMKNKDILQFDIHDTYYNLTSKLLHAFKWINLYCKQVTYVLKADEDVMVNVSNLLGQLRRHIPSENGSIYGRIFDTSDHFNVFRLGRWGVSHEEYPLNYYPKYAQGTSYTLTGNLVPKIVKTAEYFPYLHIEDVFITGIVGGVVHGAELVKLDKTSD